MAKRKREEYEAIRPELPNDVIRQILAHIPTKTAFGIISLLSKSNQFEGAWCSGREIDLDEGKPKANLDASIHFTNVLKRYLKFRTDERISKDHRRHSDQSSLLHKFRVRMAMDDPVREDILEELLNGFSKERSLRVLDLSCLSKPRRLSFQSLLNINSLTSLSLESVPIGADDTLYDSSRILLPSLKTMSLKSLSLQLQDNSFLHDLIWEGSPSLEHLTVTSCSFDRSQRYEFMISSRTLKTLAIRGCNFFDITVNVCPCLEYFTSASESPDVKRLSFYDCVNLKSIDVHEKHLDSIGVYQEMHCVNITVEAPNLTSFKYNSKDVKDKCKDGRCFQEQSGLYKALKDMARRGFDYESMFLPGHATYLRKRSQYFNFDVLDD